MGKMSITALGFVFSITALVAQDPFAMLPDSYTKQFDNEWVRVVRGRYAAHAKLPAHAHNASRTRLSSPASSWDEISRLLRSHHPFRGGGQ